MKKKIKKKIKKLESRINKLENPGHEVKTIGFTQLNNLKSDNAYDWDND